MNAETPETAAGRAQRHVQWPALLTEAGHTYVEAKCSGCGEPWPCDVARLEAENERLREALVFVLAATHPIGGRFFPLGVTAVERVCDRVRAAIDGPEPGRSRYVTPAEYKVCSTCGVELPSPPPGPPHPLRPRYCDAHKEPTR